MPRQVPLLALLLSVAVAPASQAQTPTGSTTLTNGNVAMVEGVTVPRWFSRVINVNPQNGSTAWCMRSPDGTAVKPGANLPGSFPLAPYGNTLGMPTSEEFSRGGSDGRFSFTPAGALFCTTDGNGPVALTVENY